MNLCGLFHTWRSSEVWPVAFNSEDGRTRKRILSRPQVGLQDDQTVHCATCQWKYDMQIKNVLKNNMLEIGRISFGILNCQG